MFDNGWHVNHQFVWCFCLYADDIIVISTSVIGLQQILDVFLATAKSLTLKSNGKKSHCLRLSKLTNVDIGPMLRDNQLIASCQFIKYLGVHLLSGKGLSFDITPIKRTFYAACINIFSHSHGVDESIQLSLQEVDCLPVLLYASPALFLKPKQLFELNVYWNFIYRKIFNFSKMELVKVLIFCLGRLDLSHAAVAVSVEALVFISSVAAVRKVVGSTPTIDRAVFWDLIIGP